MKATGTKVDLLGRLKEAGLIEEEEMKEENVLSSLPMHRMVKEIPEEYLKEGTLSPFVRMEEEGERSLTREVTTEANRSNHHEGTSFFVSRVVEHLQKPSNENRKKEFGEVNIKNLQVFACVWETHPETKDAWEKMVARLKENPTLQIAEKEQYHGFLLRPNTKEKINICICQKHE